MVVHSQSTGLQRGWFPSVRDLCSCQLILRLGALFVLGSSRNHIIRATRLANFCSDTQDEEGVHEGARRRVVIFFCALPASHSRAVRASAGWAITRVGVFVVVGWLSIMWRPPPLWPFWLGPEDGTQLIDRKACVLPLSCGLHC